MLGTWISVGNLTNDASPDYLIGSDADVFLMVFGNSGANLVDDPVVGYGRFPDDFSAPPAYSIGDGVGASVCFLGDLDGNGLGDFAVGAPMTNADQGEVFIFMGVSYANEAIVATYTRLAGTAPVPAPSTGDFFGQGCASLGDLDGDGSVELVVSSPGAVGSPLTVISLNASGQPIAAHVVTEGVNAPPALDFSETGGTFGNFLSTPGDLMGDATPDLIVSEEGEGAVWVLEMASNGTVTDAFKWEGLGVTSMVGIGDFNGDGLTDVAGGNPSANAGDGAVFVMTLMANLTVNVTIEVDTAADPSCGWGRSLALLAPVGRPPFNDSLATSLVLMVGGPFYHSQDRGAVLILEIDTRETVPTTLAPTTLAPTTLAPTTLAPTTLAPTTLAPTTASPTTPSPPSTTDIVMVLAGGTVGLVVGLNEAGGSHDLVLSLSAAPVSNVRLTATATAASEASFSPSYLDFTATTWNLPKTITVTGRRTDAAPGQTDVSAAFFVILRLSSSDPRVSTTAVTLSAVNADVAFPTLVVIEDDFDGLAGGKLVTLIGTEFVAPTRVEFGTVEVAVQSQTTTSIGVRVPSSPSGTQGYIDVTVTNPDGGSSTLAKALFYSAGCLEAGKVTGSDGVSCVECPSGATCPGGGRVWPHTGYWTPDETSGVALVCVPAVKCAGGRDGGCAAGYEGFLCSDCADGYYSDGSGFCLECSSPAVRIFLAVTDAIFYGALVVSLFVLPPAVVRVVAGLLSVLQAFRIAAAAGSALLPSGLQRAFDVFSLVTGEGLREGQCGATDLAFASAYFSQILLVIVFVILAFGGMRLIAYIRASSPSKSQYWKDRAVSSVTVLTVFSYSSLSMLSLKAVVCTDAGGGQRVMQADQSITCWEGIHTPVFVLAAVVLVVLTVGAPVAMLVALYRSRYKLHLSRVQARLGFLYLSFRRDAYYVAVPWLVVMFVFVLSLNLLAALPTAQAAVSGTILLAIAVAIMLIRPFPALWKNIVMACLMPLAAAVVAFPMMAEVLDPGTFTAYAMVVIALFVVLVVGTVLMLARVHCCGGGSSYQESFDRTSAVGVRKRDEWSLLTESEMGEAGVGLDGVRENSSRVSSSSMSINGGMLAPSHGSQQGTSPATSGNRGLSFSDATLATDTDPASARARRTKRPSAAPGSSQRVSLSSLNSDATGGGSGDGDAEAAVEARLRMNLGSGRGIAETGRLTLIDDEFLADVDTNELHRVAVGDSSPRDNDDGFSDVSLDGSSAFEEVSMTSESGAESRYSLDESVPALGRSFSLTELPSASGSGALVRGKGSRPRVQSLDVEGLALAVARSKENAAGEVGISESTLRGIVLDDSGDDGLGGASISEADMAKMGSAAVPLPGAVPLPLSMGDDTLRNLGLDSTNDSGIDFSIVAAGAEPLSLSGTGNTGESVASLAPPAINPGKSYGSDSSLF